MAEEPRFFTIGPWGYRILLPGLLGAFLPPRWIVPGFEWAARVSLVAASGLLFVYLRILGGTYRAALLAVLAVMATPSVSTVFENPFLVEPFALMLMLLALIAIEGDANPWTVSLALLLLSLSKEIWLVLLPLIFLRETWRGFRPAVLKTLYVSIPALWAGLLIRFMWPPHAADTTPGSDYLLAIRSIASNVALFAPDYLLGGLAIVAVIALYREEAREYLADHALTLAPLIALPLVAATFNGEGAAENFFAADIARLLSYTLPFVAGLAIHLDPDQGRPGSLATLSFLGRPSMVILGFLAVAPLGLDRYSRLDLSDSRDGPYVLGMVRESLRTARRLDRGDAVIFDPQERKFAWGVTPPSELGKLRFFLRDGFGPRPHYGIHEIRMKEPKATLIVPLLDPRTLRLTLTLDAHASTWITFLVGGRKAGEALVGPQAVAVTLEVAGSRLFRGDNSIELQCETAPTAKPRILRIELSQPKTTK